MFRIKYITYKYKLARYLQLHSKVTLFDFTNGSFVVHVVQVCFFGGTFSPIITFTELLPRIGNVLFSINMFTLSFFLCHLKKTVRRHFPRICNCITNTSFGLKGEEKNISITTYNKNRICYFD